MVSEWIEIDNQFVKDSFPFAGGLTRLLMPYHLMMPYSLSLLGCERSIGKG